MRIAFIKIFALFCIANIGLAGNAQPSKNKVCALQGFLYLPEVQIFIQDMVKKHHFKKNELVCLIAKVHSRPPILFQIRNQNEYKSWSLYRKIYVSEQRIRAGIEFWQQHQDVLQQVAAKTSVPEEIIVATIGVESKYGKIVGKYPVIDALVNLAFASDSKRKKFFRYELEAFLLLAREQKIAPETILGSYAGAIGQPQFMPSSFKHYAISYSHKKQIDLTNNVDDVIASVANYYQLNGWRAAEPIAIPASMQGGRFQFSLTKPKSISLFEVLEKNAAVTTATSKKSPRLIILRTNYRNEYWRGYKNFDVIKRYNHSEHYAMAILQLSQHLALER